MTKRIRLTVAYDGTNYHGWQIQNNPNTEIDTIEARLIKAISDLLGKETEIIGASRTDSGVHALGNIAVFDTDSPIPAEKFAGAINARLPEDIRVVFSDEVAEDWHPRKQDCRKTYEYRIGTGRVQAPTKRLYEHFMYHELDIEAMSKACAPFIGEHDFAAFCSNPKMKKSTVRNVDSIDIFSDGEYLTFTFHGSGFLQHMVRILVGTLLEVGFSKRTPESILTLLENRDRKEAGPTAPACGLCLIKVDYH